MPHHPARSRRLLSFGLACAPLLPLAAAAQGSELDPTQRNWLQLQLFSPSIHSSARLDDLFATTATDLQFEDGLHLSDRKAVPMLNLGRRIGQRWRIEMDYFELPRSGQTGTLAQPLQAGDTTFAAGSVVQSNVKLGSLRLAAGVSLLQTPTAEVGLAFGGSFTRAAVHVSGSTPSGGGSTPVTVDRWLSQFLPMVGVYGTVALAPQWQLSGRAEGMHGDGSSQFDLQINAVWRASPWVSVGAGLRTLQGRLQDEPFIIPTPGGQVDYRMTGPQVFAQFAF